MELHIKVSGKGEQRGSSNAPTCLLGLHVPCNGLASHPSGGTSKAPSHEV